MIRSRGGLQAAWQDHRPARAFRGVGRQNRLVPEADRAVGEVTEIAGTAQSTGLVALPLGHVRFRLAIDTPESAHGLAYNQPDKMAFSDLAEDRGCGQHGPPLADPECALDTLLRPRAPRSPMTTSSARQI